MATIVYLEYWKRTPRYHNGRKYRRKLATFSDEGSHDITLPTLPKEAYKMRMVTVHSSSIPRSFTVKAGDVTIESYQAGIPGHEYITKF